MKHGIIACLLGLLIVVPSRNLHADALPPPLEPYRIGTALDIRPEGLRVTAVTPNLEGAKKGLRAGDLIVIVAHRSTIAGRFCHLNGTYAAALSPSEVRALAGADQRQPLTLGIVRGGRSFLWLSLGE